MSIKRGAGLLLVLILLVHGIDAMPARLSAPSTSSQQSGGARLPAIKQTLGQLFSQDKAGSQRSSHSSSSSSSSLSSSSMASAPAKTKTPVMQVGTPESVRTRLFQFNKNMRGLRDTQTEFAATRANIKEKKKAGPLDEMNKHGLKQLINEKAIEMKGEREAFKATTIKDAKKLANAAGKFDNDHLDRMRYEHAKEVPMKWNLKKPSNSEVQVQRKYGGSGAWSREGHPVSEPGDRGSRRQSPSSAVTANSHQRATPPSTASRPQKYVSPFAEGSGSRSTSMDSAHGRVPIAHSPPQIHKETSSVPAGQAYRTRHRTGSEESVNGPARSNSPTSSQFRTPTQSPQPSQARLTRSQPASPKGGHHKTNSV